MIRSILILTSLFLMPIFGHAQDPRLPLDCRMEGAIEETSGGITPAGNEGIMSLEGVIPAESPFFILKAKLGAGKGLRISLTGIDGETTSFAMNASDHKRKNVVNPDAFIALSGWGRQSRYYVRPNPSFYTPKEFEKRRADWEKLPGASEHVFTLMLKPSSGNETQLWMDGQLVHILPGLITTDSYKITLYSGAVVSSLQFAPETDGSSLSLPVLQHPRESGIVNPRLEFNASVPTELNPTLRNLTGQEIKGIGVGGLGVIPGLATDDLQSFFWRRHATHQLPEQRMFSIPLAVYGRAWVLCAADYDPLKVSAFTFRLTRYGGSRGNAMADTLVTLPPADSPDMPQARRVGTVSYGPESHRQTTPLWLIEVPIRNGAISDLLFQDEYADSNLRTHRYLDVDLLDPLLNAEEAYAFPPSMQFVGRNWRPTDPEFKTYDYYGKHQPPATSGVTIFDITLEESPAWLQVRANTGVQAFYASEAPKFIAKVNAQETGDYRLQWDIVDIEGKAVATGEKSIACEKGAEVDVEIPINQSVGWYAARFRLIGGKERDLYDYQTSFVMLPPDTRKAGYESPFYGFWFEKNQRSDVKLDEVGPLLQRAGIRRAGLPDDMPESLSQKYGVTKSTVRFSALGGRKALNDFRDGRMTLEQAIAFHEADIRHHFELWPSIDRMLVFHESGARGASIPNELWGDPPSEPLDAADSDENSPEALLRKEGATPANDVRATKAKEEWEKNWPKRIEYLSAMSKMVREKFPQLKMQYGNDGNSLAIMGELFRQKFPKEWIDTIAVEDLGQTFAPERALVGGLHSAWFLRELARKMGYGDVPITACTEWIGRMTERLGLKTQAEWKVRDGLLALAYGFDTISIAGINDASSGYYHSIWANGGLCGRYPTMAPKPAFAAVATLTQVLDQAKFTRFIPTGSSVLYLQEFQKDDGWVYACWTPRGVREIALEFPEAGDRSLIDLYGRTEERTGASLTLDAGTGVQYLTSKTPVQSASAAKGSFPEDSAPEDPIETIPLEALGDLTIVSNTRQEEISLRHREIPRRKQGNFELREVEDPEMGRCLELELKTDSEIGDLDQEYVYLKLPASISTTARNAGVWIKGNGSWGNVDIWKSRWGPWTTNSNLQMAWSGAASLNFDGWNFITYPYYDWVREGEPTYVQGLVITIPRKVLIGTELTPVPNLKVRIKSILLF